MKFEIKGVKEGPGLQRFYHNWVQMLMRENEYFFGKPYISTYQRMIVDISCGRTTLYEGEDNVSKTYEIKSDNDAQAEFEALVRAKNRAMAALFVENMG